MVVVRQLPSSDVGASGTMVPTSPLHLSEISSLSDAQEKALSVLRVVSATLSVVGSFMIIYRVKRNNRRQTPYDRIMTGLSACDIIASVSQALMPFLLPSKSSQRVWASGNDTTCSMLGFLQQFAFSAVWYNGMLSYYYLAIIRFGVKPQEFAKRYEILVHFFSLSFFVITASLGVGFGIYSEMEITQGCWIGEFPAGCEARDDCVGNSIAWVFGGFPTLFSFVSIAINNWVVFFHVRHTTFKLLHSQASHQLRSLNELRLKEVATQGFLYVAGFFCTYTAAFAIRVLESFGFDAANEADIFWLLALNACFLPAQGFFNMFIFTRPNYMRVRVAYPHQSTLWTLRKACFDPDIPNLTHTNRKHNNKNNNEEEEDDNDEDNDNNIRVDVRSDQLSATIKGPSPEEISMLQSLTTQS